MHACLREHDTGACVAWAGTDFIGRGERHNALLAGTLRFLGFALA
jgi:hypothetical protein